MSLLPPAVRAGRYAPLNFCQCFFYCGAMVQKVFGKNTNFCFFQKIANLWKCFAKISVTKYREWKFWDCYLFPFSALIVVVYSVFSVDAFFTEKIAKQNRLFCWRRENLSFLRILARSKWSNFDRSNLHPINGPYGKFGHFHVEEIGQSFATHPSNLFLDSVKGAQFDRTYGLKNTILAFFIFFKKTKFSENVSQKSLWQSFENEKSGTAILFVFPRWSSWCTPFFLSTHFSLRKSRNKIAFFAFFEKIQKLMKSMCNFRYFWNTLYPFFFHRIGEWSIFFKTRYSVYKSDQNWVHTSV